MPRTNATNHDAMHVLDPAQEIAVADYAENMFADGNNRTARQSPNSAKAYDNAAHTSDAETFAMYGDATGVEDVLEGTVDTFHSRDGTDAAGRDAEDGGSLGGTTEELDNFEVSGVAVDKNPRMKG